MLDGIDVFVDGGPMSGKRIKGNVFLAATDRVALDAVGVAILKFLVCTSLFSALVPYLHPYSKFGVYMPII